jgi:hypothetical protein
MGTKKKHLMWMSFLGQTIYENLNPYWSFCEEINSIPDKMIIFHAAENKSGFLKAKQALSIVSEGFGKNRVLDIKGVAFDDEDVQGFYDKAEQYILKADSEKMKVFVDVSPTTWSFVPVYLIKLAEKYKNIIKSTGYTQYVDHGSRKLPYPLIPYKGIIVHDFGTI